MHTMCIGGGRVNDGSQDHPLRSESNTQVTQTVSARDGMSEMSTYFITEMTDLSRVKLKEPWSDDPEGFFTTIDHMYAVWALHQQRGRISPGKVARDTQRLLKRFNASSKSIYPMFMEWWEEKGTKCRAIDDTQEVLVRDRGRIVA